MPGSSWKDSDIPGSHYDLMAVLAAEHEPRLTACETEDLVRSRVIVMKVIDAIAPLRRPAIALKKIFKMRCGISSRYRNSIPIKEHWKVLIVRHPAIARQLQRFRPGGAGESGPGGSESQPRQQRIEPATVHVGHAELDACK